MATDNSQYRDHQRDLIDDRYGSIAVSFGPHYSNGDTVVRLVMADGHLHDPAGNRPPLTIALGLEHARQLRNTLNAVIGLIVEDAKT